MKVVLPRVGALVIVVALGWIAIAQAQRNTVRLSAGDNTSSAEESGNPLRTDAGSSASLGETASGAAPANPIRPKQTAQVPATDPFGLQSRTIAPPPATPAPQTPSTIPDAATVGLAAPLQNEPGAPNPLRPANPPAKPLAEINAPPSRTTEPPRYPTTADANQDSHTLLLAAASAPERPMARQVAAEQPINGPELAPPTTLQSTEGSRYATAPLQPVPATEEPHLAAVPAQAGAKLAPFRDDPAPSAPVRATAVTREAPVRQERAALPSMSAGPKLEPAAGVAGMGQPGAKHLEGPQTPQLSIQKMVPQEIQVGKPAVFRVVVRNVGQAPASDVEIRDQIPRGTQLMGTTPRTSPNNRGELVWPVGTLRPGEETAVEIQLMPIAEGEVGSVASVHFGADASARCQATRPQLVVETTLPEKVMIGDKINLSITISNPGTGVATGVVLEEHVPAGFQHPAGNELEYEVGDLKPGESRKLDLPLVAQRPGPLTNMLLARADGNLRAEDKRNIEVLAPQLDVALDGPKKRFLERPATYQVSVSNPGTAAAQQVELVAYLPPGLKFVNANNHGQYDGNTRTVRWRLAELPANETGPVEFVTIPVEAGEYAIKLRATAEKGLTAEKEQPVSVEGIAAIHYQVSTAANPIQLGGQTTYEIRVANQGSKASNNVQLMVLLPPELKPVGADGPTSAANDGNGRVVFKTLPRLAPKSDVTFRVRVQGLKAGDFRARFQLQTDELRSPVTKEECTQVYADE